MLSFARRRMTFANVAMTLALVFAMSGGAFAAGKFLITSTKQISPKVLASLKGKAGAKGANGAQGQTGATGAAGPAGAVGPQGPAGVAGTAGTAGTSVTGAAASKAECEAGGVKYTSASGSNAVCNGKNGTTGFTKTLPSGATETGTWSFGHETAVSAEAAISFPIPLAEAISEANAHFFVEGTAPPLGCSVSESGELKTTQSGTLCIMSSPSVGSNVTKGEVGTLNLETGEEGAGKTGLVLVMSPSKTTKGLGLWAVTAP